MRQHTYKITVNDEREKHFYVTDYVEAYDLLEAVKKFINEWDGEITHMTVFKETTGHWTDKFITVNSDDMDV